MARKRPEQGRKLPKHARKSRAQPRRPPNKPPIQKATEKSDDEIPSILVGKIQSVIQIVTDCIKSLDQGPMAVLEIQNDKHNHIDIEIKRLKELANKLHFRYISLLKTQQVLSVLTLSETNLDKKRELASRLNRELRLIGAAFSHPTTGHPCILYAIQSNDIKGRYTLEDRETKKRFGHYESLRELMPFHFVPDLPRK